MFAGPAARVALHLQTHLRWLTPPTPPHLSQPHGELGQEEVISPFVTFRKVRALGGGWGWGTRVPSSASALAHRGRSRSEQAADPNSVPAPSPCGKAGGDAVTCRVVAGTPARTSPCTRAPGASGDITVPRRPHSGPGGLGRGGLAPSAPAVGTMPRWGSTEGQGRPVLRAPVVPPRAPVRVSGPPEPCPVLARGQEGPRGDRRQRVRGKGARSRSAVRGGGSPAPGPRRARAAGGRSGPRAGREQRG